MKFLYLILNIGTIAIPFVYSFNKKLNFKAHWKPIFKAILIISIPFIFWDIIFTLNEVWGFNQNYLLGFSLLELPIEEWLFFICIPYACVFTYYAVNFYLSNLKPSKKVSNHISIFLLILFVSTSLFNLDKLYTSVNFIFSSVILFISFIGSRQHFKSFMCRL